MLASSHDVAEAMRDVRAALGREPADLVLRGCSLVNVCSEEVHGADIAIRGNRIVAIRERYEGATAQDIDATGLFAQPGAIEPFRVPAGFVADAQLATRLLQAGITTLIVPAGFAAPELTARGIKCLALGSDALPLQTETWVGSADEALTALRRGETVMLDPAQIEDWSTLFATLVARRIDSGRFIVAQTNAGVPVAGAVMTAAIAAGIKPGRALQMLSFNPGIHYSLDHEIGSLSPGRKADIILTRQPGGAPVRIILEGQSAAFEPALVPKLGD